MIKWKKDENTEKSTKVAFYDLRMFHNIEIKQKMDLRFYIFITLTPISLQHQLKSNSGCGNCESLYNSGISHNGHRYASQTNIPA